MLQYIIELAAAAMNDVEPSHDTSGKRDLLAKYTRASRRFGLDDMSEYTIPNLSPWNPSVVLQGGGGVVGSILSQRSGSKGIQFWQLPSSIRGIPIRNHQNPM